MDEVLLDEEQVEALRVLVEASRAVSRDDREPFSYKFVVGERSAIIEHPGLPEQVTLILFADIEVLEKAGLVHVSREAKSYGSLFVMPAGFRYYETEGSTTSHLESRRQAIKSENANIPLSSNPAREDVTRSDHGARDSAQERPPDTLWAAVLRHIWKASPKVRVLVLISIALLAAILAIWSTLPDAAKERLLGIEKPPADTRLTTQTDTKTVVRPAPDHDRSTAGGLADSIVKVDQAPLNDNLAVQPPSAGALNSGGPPATTPPRSETATAVTLPAPILDSTADALMAALDGHTQAQGARLAAPQLGRRIKISGSLSNVSTSDSGARATVTVDVGVKQTRNVFARFSTPLTNAEFMDSGDHVVIIGTIASYDQFHMILDESVLASWSQRQNKAIQR